MVIITFKEIKIAKKLKWKHHKWFLRSGKSIYEVIKYLASNDDFWIEPSNYAKTNFRQIGYQTGNPSISGLEKWLIENKKYEHLIIRASEGGTAKGILNIKLFIHLREK